MTLKLILLAVEVALLLQPILFLAGAYDVQRKTAHAYRGRTPDNKPTRWVGNMYIFRTVNGRKRLEKVYTPKPGLWKRFVEELQSGDLARS